MVGIQFHKDVDLSQICKQALSKGLLIISAGENTLRIVPPLIISKNELDIGLDILKSVLIQCFSKN